MVQLAVDSDSDGSGRSAHCGLFAVREPDRGTGEESQREKRRFPFHGEGSAQRAGSHQKLPGPGRGGSAVL